MSWEEYCCVVALRATGYLEAATRTASHRFCPTVLSHQAWRTSDFWIDNASPGSIEHLACYVPVFARMICLQCAGESHPCSFWLEDTITNPDFGHVRFFLLCLTIWP